jgi:Predicted transcriptional regulators
MHARATETARLLRALANASRLMLLCRLFQQGEANAGQLAAELGMGLSALSQHLARMLEEGLIEQRRQGRQLFYRISDSASGQLPVLLASICDDAPMSPTDSGEDTMKPSTVLAAVLGLTLAASSVQAADGFWVTPTIHGAGKMHALPQAAYQPDPRAVYKVVFNMTTASPKPDEVSPALQRVARTVNLYVNAGVPLKHLHFVAIASGAATAIALDDAAYSKIYHVPNPNLPVIEQLRKAGIDVSVCGQAVAEHDYAYDSIDKHVTLSLSALVTVTELQQKGYALMPL